MVARWSAEIYTLITVHRLNWDVWTVETYRAATPASKSRLTWQPVVVPKRAGAKEPLPLSYTFTTTIYIFDAFLFSPVKWRISFVASTDMTRACSRVSPTS